VNALIAIGWDPELRGILTVIIGTVVFGGSTYLLVGTNIGARLGFLVSFAALFGWMAVMGAVWWAYGIGLQGTSPSWQPAEPFTIIREADDLTAAEVLDEPVRITDPTNFPQVADEASTAIQDQGWIKLPEADPGRGQAIASADEIIQIEAELFAAGEYEAVAVYDKGGERWPKVNDSIDFVAFFHKPHYALVEIAPVLPQREEPGRAPARPVIDDEQPHQYVLMLRDLGNRRQPAAIITIGSTLIFALCCYLLHRRDKIVAQNRSMVPAKV
jgi:hypothetical protein